MSTPNLIPEAPAVEPASPPAISESLGWQLRAALPPLRLHSVSLYDTEGEVLWLSEGALGPDEQSFVVEALSELKDQPSQAHRETDFHDGRGAVFLAVRAARAELAGLVMILVDAKALAAGGLADRVFTSQVEDILRRLAISLLPPSKAAPAPAAAVPAASAAPAAATAPQSRPRADSTGTISLEILAPKEIDDILTFELAHEAVTPSATPPSSATVAQTAEPPRFAAAESSPEPLPKSPAVVLAEPSRTTPSEPAEPPHEPPHEPAHEPAREPDLSVQELTKLRPGGRMRRFQVLSRAPASAAAPAAAALTGATFCGVLNASAEAARTLVAALKELTAWLAANPHLTERVPLTFALAVSALALEAEDLPDLVAGSLRDTAVGLDGIGFQIEESLYVRHRARAERFVRTVEQLGTFLVIDDFTFDSGALELLRSKALRLVKIDPALVVAALRDKLAQARIVAISQAARVLGVHCAAKRVDGEATRRWLAAAGFDFAEGPMFDAPVSLASLAVELAEPK